VGPRVDAKRSVAHRHLDAGICLKVWALALSFYIRYGENPIYKNMSSENPMPFPRKKRRKIPCHPGATETEYYPASARSANPTPRQLAGSALHTLSV
jgi:hypothetical protein